MIDVDLADIVRMLWGAPGAYATAALIAVLVLRELLRAAGDPGRPGLAVALNVMIVPLLAVFGAMVLARIGVLLRLI